jgi:hypothetical protein
VAITKLLSFECEAEVLGQVRQVQVYEGGMTIRGVSITDAHAILKALANGTLVAVEVPEAAPVKADPLEFSEEFKKENETPPKPQPAPTAPPAAAPPSPASTNSAAATAGSSRSEPDGLPGFIDWSGTWCGALVGGRACGKKQYETTSGSTCEAGHGGADPLGAPAPGGQAFTPPPAEKPKPRPSEAAGQQTTATPAARPSQPPAAAPAAASPPASTRATTPTPSTTSEGDDLFGPPPAPPAKPAPAMTPAQREVGDMPAWGGGPQQGWPADVSAAKNLKEVLSALVRAGHKTEGALLSETEKLKAAGHPVVKVIADLPKRVKTACSAFAEQFGIVES